MAGHNDNSCSNVPATAAATAATERRAASLSAEVERGRREYASLQAQLSELLRAQARRARDREEELQREVVGAGTANVLEGLPQAGHI